MHGGWYPTYLSILQLVWTLQRYYNQSCTQPLSILDCSRDERDEWQYKRKRGHRVYGLEVTLELAVKVDTRFVHESCRLRILLQAPSFLSTLALCMHLPRFIGLTIVLSCSPAINAERCVPQFQPSNFADTLSTPSQPPNLDVASPPLAAMLSTPAAPTSVRSGPAEKDVVHASSLPAQLPDGPCPFYHQQPLPEFWRSAEGAHRHIKQLHSRLGNDESQVDEVAAEFLSAIALDPMSCAESYSRFQSMLATALSHKVNGFKPLLIIISALLLDTCKDCSNPWWAVLSRSKIRQKVLIAQCCSYY